MILNNWYKKEKPFVSGTSTTGGAGGFAVGSDASVPEHNIEFDNPITDNLQVWLDPRKWTSLATNQNANFGTGSSSSGTWRIMTANGAYASGTNSQGILPATAGQNMSALTYGQSISNMNGIENYSMQFWIYIGSQNVSSWGFIGGKSRFWSSNDGGIFIQSNGTEWGFHTSTDGTLDMDIPANGWHNVCGVRDLSASNCRKMYVDGSLAIEDNVGDGTNNSHTLNNTAGLSLLGDSNSSATSLGYQIGSYGYGFGHCLFYSDALSASEQLTNFNNSKAVYGL